MSKISDLIAKLCPNGVEYKKLGDVAKIVRGERITKKDLIPDGQYPVISGGVNPLGRYDKFNREPQTITIAQYGTAGYVNWQTERFWANDVCYSVYPIESVLPRYLYQVLMWQQPHIYELKTDAIPAHLPQVKLESILIPVPPVKIQREVVEVLDKFALLTAELTAELEKRKKQYEHYRDKLLKFTQGGGYKQLTLGEIATIERGNGLQKSDFIESGYPCIHYGQVHTRFGTATSNVLSYVSADLAKSLKVVHSGDIIMAVTSEDVDCVCKCTAWVGGFDIVTGGHTAIIRHNQNAKYLSYYFQTPDFAAQKKKLAHGTKVIEVTPSKLADIKIPLPTLEKQAEVVALLDKFDKLCNDLTSGLPAEIAARKKQYEYYRDKLLTFKRKEAA